MLQIIHALQDEEPEHWRVVAQAWGIELPVNDPLDALIRAMLDPARVAEVFDRLPEDARMALAALRRSGGRIPMAVFAHRYGELRAMGPGRRQREQPWLHPVSATERLWYGGWIGRAFIRAGGTSQEYAYVPADLEALLPAGSAATPAGWRLLSYQPSKDERIFSAKYRAAQDACTLMAFLRLHPQPASRDPLHWSARATLLRHLHFPEAVPLLLFLLREKDLLAGDLLQPDAQAAAMFLEGSLAGAAESLRLNWESSRWNDLAAAGDWTVEGDWPNDPVESRRRFLESFDRAPAGEWCTLDSLVAAVRETEWEFLRPASSFEEWMIRNREGDFLKGMDSWDQVEGVLARYLIAKPMAWLGWVELAPAAEPRAFRRIPGDADVRPASASAPAERKMRVRIHNDGTVLLPPDIQLMLRYRLARCSEWVGRSGDVFVYRITPRSLDAARRQDIRVAHILPLLKRLAGEVPASLERALRRWEKNGAEARMNSERLLVPRSPEAAAQIAARAETMRGLLRPVEGPVWIVASAGARRVREALGREGLLIDEADAS